MQSLADEISFLRFKKNSARRLIEVMIGTGVLANIASSVKSFDLIIPKTLKGPKHGGAPDLLAPGC